jgi:hypothetical protein
MVVLKYAALYYWLMWPTICLSILALLANSVFLYVATAIAWVLLVSMAVPYWPTVFELKRMMREKSIKSQGSKYSLSNPLRYEWEE